MTECSIIHDCQTHFFTDTMFAGTASVGGNKCAQVCTTSFGWCRAHPMKRKGEAHETLLFLFHRDGVLKCMVADNPKEQILGEFQCNFMKQIAT